MTQTGNNLIVILFICNFVEMETYPPNKPSGKKVSLPTGRQALLLIP